MTVGQNNLGMTEHVVGMRSGSISPLVIMVLAVDLVTPLLIWKGVLPASSRWISHAAIVAIMAYAFMRMMVFDWVPGIVWLIAWISVTGIVVATLEGQSLGATAWGWWTFFQFPLIGLFAYLQPNWPDRFPDILLKFCLAVLGIEIVLQITQYLAGEPPGDDLAGTFGESGTTNLVVFVLFVLCLALGRWLVRGQWTALLIVLVLGGASSVLGEAKIFPFAVFALGSLALVMFSIRRGQVWQLAKYTLLLCGVLWAFITAYDLVVPNARGSRPLEQYLEPEILTSYFGGARRIYTRGGEEYDIGRNYALEYGWREISKDPVTLLFGYGLGARGESVTLGTAGVGLLRGYLGLSVGTSLSVMMQELGITGLLVLGAFFLWIIMTLARGIRSGPDSDALELRAALLLFTLLWPLWLWYTSAWTLRVPMLLYWISIGYALNELNRKSTKSERSREINTIKLRRKASIYGG